MKDEAGNRSIWREVQDRLRPWPGWKFRGRLSIMYNMSKFISFPPAMASVRGEHLYSRSV